MNGYLADLNEQAEDMFFRLVRALAEKDGIAEMLAFSYIVPITALIHLYDREPGNEICQPTHDAQLGSACGALL